VAVAFALVAFVLAVGPHWGFSYPIHVDEWTHLAYAEALVQNGRIPHLEPLYGLDTVGFRPELGFRVILAQLHLATGLNWEVMFPALAGATFALFVVTMLYLGRVLGAGILIGILALGTPTTLRFLGPALAVPVALSLTLLAAVLVVLLQPSLRERWLSPAVLGLLLLATLLVHPTTALIAAPLALVVSGYTALQHPGTRKGPLWVCAGLGFVLPLAWFLALPGSVRAELLTEAGRGVTSGVGQVLEYVYYAGYVRIAAFGIAAFGIMVWKPRLPYLALLAAYALLLGSIRLHEVGVLGAAYFYDRSWLYLDVTLSVTGGLGLAVIGERLARSRWAASRAIRYGRPVLVGALAVGVVATAWYTRTQEPLYRLTSSAHLENFRWIREHLADTPGLTLIDPKVSVVYPAVAGRPVYASMSEPKPSPDQRVQMALGMLVAPQPDVEALRQKNIGIVYEPRWRAWEGLQEVRPGIFVVTGE
jgi:hypothetical protein